MIWLLAGAMLIAKLFPETQAGRWLHRHLVELPLRTVEKLERRHLFYIAVLLVAGQGLALVGTADLAMVAAWDASLYLDIMAAAWTVAAVTRWKTAWAFLRSTAQRLVGREPPAVRAPEQSRAPRVRVPSVPANDDAAGDTRRRA
jgi:hypothetical protein